MSKQPKRDPGVTATPAGPVALDEGTLESVQGGVSLLLPAVQSAREAAATKAQRSNDFKLVGPSLKS